MTTATLAARDGPASISEVAYRELAHAIETCTLPPGARLNERAEALRMGMSRTPIRQALHRLSLEGLVTLDPSRGASVAPLDPEDVQNNMLVRQAIELEMAQLLITSQRRIDFAALAHNLGRQRAAIASGDWRTFLHADELFHQAIVAAAGNPRATDAVARSWKHLNRARYLTQFTKAQMRQALADHREIVAGLHARDPERTRWAIRRHLGGPLATRLDDLRALLPQVFGGPGAATYPVPPPEGRM